MDIVNQKLNADSLSKILFIYGLFSLVVAFAMSFSTGKEIRQSVSMAGGEVGPIQVTDANSVYLIDVFQSVGSNSWSSITIDVLDENKQYLFAFGDELWKESGYDSDGSWTESNNSFNIKVTFPKEGIYYLSLAGENSNNNPNALARVTVNQKIGSSLAFSIIGILSLLAAIAIWFYQNKDRLVPEP
ncbi:MAG: hypothetical protein ACC707_01815 [Thiohalomonadales bacterium]